MEYNSAIKRNKLLVHTVTCINLQRIMLSEKKPILKSYIVYESVYTNSLNDKMIEMKNRSDCQQLRKE